MPSSRFAAATRLTRLAGLCATTLVFAGLHTAAMAQSRFTVSTLKPPYLGRLEANQIIDNQNRVFSDLFYYNGIGLKVAFGGDPARWVTKYNRYPSSWPAATTASLSPTKLLNTQYLRVTGLSPNGSKLLVSRMFTANDVIYFAPVVYDTATRQPLNYVIDGSTASQLNKGAEAASVNDQGWVAGTVTLAPDVLSNSQTSAARWRPGQAVEMLSMPADMTHSGATSINAAGEVAGWVGRPSGNSYIDRRAAKWGVDGTVQVLTQSHQDGYDVVSIADNGTVLKKGTAPRSDGNNATAFTLVSANGTTVALPIADNQYFGYDMGHHSLSPDGDTVVGSKQVYASAAQQASTRAFLFKDGVMHDLTDYAKARGLKLPTGTHLSAATSVNAQGSITTGYNTSDGKFVALKLTAVP